MDSFAVNLPFVTTDIPIHCLEIAYLEPGVTRLMLPHNVQEFADSVTTLFADPARLCAMALAAGNAARRSTLENMVANVADGLGGCLGTKAREPLIWEPR